MISAFYKFSPSKKEKISRQKGNAELFMIPKQHLLNNEEDIARLKKQCLKYQRQFTFIKNQIEREARLKKEKSRDHFQMDRQQLENALQFKSHHKNREERRKILGITQRELLRKKVQNDEGVSIVRKEQAILINSIGINRKINTNTH